MASSTLSIGDFSRATHVTVKMLRHYHQIGLLEPADVDPGTGYRRYTVEQIPRAQVIRRFRDMDMPLEQIGAVLDAPDVADRNRLIFEHLGSLEDRLARTQSAITSLRDLLDQPSGPGDTDITFRHVDPTPAATVSETIDMEDAGLWLQGAIGEIRASLLAQGVEPSGPPGGIYANELFEHERGQATVFVPCGAEVRAIGRVGSSVVPGVELATLVHPGSHRDVDRAYGALARFVAQRALGVDGPIRESYLVGITDTDDDTAWRTEIGWPVFRTA